MSNPIILHLESPLENVHLDLWTEGSRLARQIDICPQDLRDRRRN